MLRSFAGGQVFGATAGSGAPRVLALHGWARTHRDFDAVLQTDGVAAGDLPAVALDLPGFGATPPPAEPWGTARYAEAVVPVLDEMSSPVVVLGHSFGGRVAVQLAAAHPDRVSALVLTGVPLLRPPGRPARPAVSYRLVRTLHRAHLVSPARLEAARQRHGSADYRAARGVMRQVLVKIVAEHYEEQLAVLGCPVRLVWGDDDSEVPLATAQSALGLLADAELTVCAGAGHMTPLSVPSVLREAVQRSLA
jgi:pimeloyl-ACP methyl ester carboxylesterase